MTSIWYISLSRPTPPELSPSNTAESPGTHVAWEGGWVVSGNQRCYECLPSESMVTPYRPKDGIGLNCRNMWNPVFPLPGQSLKILSELLPPSPPFPFRSSSSPAASDLNCCRTSTATSRSQSPRRRLRDACEGERWGALGRDPEAWKNSYNML